MVDLSIVTLVYQRVDRCKNQIGLIPYDGEVPMSDGEKSHKILL